MRTTTRSTAALSLLLAATAPAAARAALSPGYLRAEYRVDPMGLDTPAPRLSWVLQESDPAARGQRQTAYEVRVGSDPAKLDQPDVWDSGPVKSDQQNQVAYAGRPLASGQRCWWQVRAWDKDGQPSPWSRPAMWSMGLLAPADWTAQWIGSPAARDRGGVMGPSPTTPGDRMNSGELRPPIRFRKGFDVPGPVRRATLYATAAGVYELSLNGRPVTADVLAPGWPEYAKRVFYRTYDVTDLLHGGGGANALGATVADGWWGLHHGGRGDLGLRLQLDVELADGSHRTIGTDPTWRASAEGPVRMSDIYQGETYDARRTQPGWDTAGFDDRDWSPTVPWTPVVVSPTRDVTAVVRAAIHDGKLSFKVANDALGGDPAQYRPKVLRVDYHANGQPGHRDVSEHKTLALTGATIDRAEYGAAAPTDVRASTLTAHPGVPVRRTGELPARVRMQPQPGTYVYDLGQNFTGWVRLRAAAPAGTTATLRFAEALNPDGTVYTTNLRQAACTDRYTFAGTGVETYEPHFTFHGFRYVELTGLPAAPPDDAVTGVVVGSDAPLTSTFACADPLLDQLQHNIVWSQRGNYLEVPTDCPQRDERRGWSGDAQAFIRTGTYNQDLAAFFTAWLRTYDDTQAADGAFPDVAPSNVGGTSPGWGDAGVICPWVLYQRYGDTRVLADGYPHMARWIDYLQANSKGLVRPAQGYGDWLSINANTPKDLIATAYFAYSTALVGRVAGVLGKPDDAAKYADLHRQIAAAFRQAFVTPDGHVKGETQTGYLLALGYDLLEPAQRPVAVAQLQKLIHDRQDHLSVGFLGVNLLLPVLADNGDVPLAYKLLENDTYPSWGYPIRHGATTVWERWNGWTADKGFADPGMNSFNHYAYGSCGQWMFAGVAGLGADRPGFAHVVVHPRPGGDVTFADATYDSIRGPVAVHWGLDGHAVHLAVTVPPNVTATVYVPSVAAAAVTEGHGPASQARGVTFVRSEAGSAVYDVGSGRYEFGGAIR